MQGVIDRMEWADGVIFATTTFFMQPTALTKNLIDHFCFMTHRPYFFAKKALVLSTTGGVGAKDTVKYLAGWFRALGFNKCYELPVVSSSWNAYRLNDKIKLKCAKLSKKFHMDVVSRRLHAPRWLILIPYNLFRGMSLSYIKGTEYEYMDGIHWSDPYRTKSVYDPSIPVPLYKKPFGGLFYIIGKIAPKFITLTYRK